MIDITRPDTDTDMKSCERQVWSALDWVHPTPGIIEMRPTDPDGKFQTGLFTDHRKLVEEAADYSGRAVYWTINQIHGSLAPLVTNEIDVAQKGGCINSKHICRITTIPFDLDPVRPKGWPATDAEHAASRELAYGVRDYLASFGFPRPAVFDSGNGTYLIYPCDLDPALKPLVRAFIEHMDKRFSNEKVLVDKSVWKLPQILRVPGTWNRKKQSTPERPHRPAWIIEIPEKRELVTAEMLSRVVPIPVPKEDKPDNWDKQSGEQRSQLLQRYCDWLKTRNIPFALEPQPSGTCIRLERCPFKGQEDGRTWIWVSEYGHVAAGCWHAKCSRKTLADVHRVHKWEQWLEEQNLPKDATSEHFTDPHRLAVAHLNRHAVNGHRTYVHLGEKLYSWQEGVYAPVSDKAIAPALTATIKAEFDDHAARLKEQGGSGVVQAVKCSHVGNTLNALKSVVRLPAHKEPPCWLSPHRWDPEDCIPFTNGILNVRAYLDGGDYFIPSAPALFNTTVLGFAYDPNAPEPTRWKQFVSELWEDSAGHDLLHEWGGYCMDRDTSRQKYVTLQGETRAGKGTICYVMGQVVGGNFGSPSYRGILGKNGLETLRGRQLAIFPDAKGIPRNVLSEFCGLLCAITGEDPLPIDCKYERVVTEQLKLKVILQLNETLAIPDNSSALEARQLFLHFTRSFRGKEDTQLKVKLARELPGIANLFLGGLRRLHANGSFTEPQSSRELARVVQREAVPLRTFVDEMCVVDPGCAILIEEMHAAYSEWAEGNDQVILPKHVFGRELFQVCRTLDRSQNAVRYQVAPIRYLTQSYAEAISKRPYYYLGIRLKDQQEPTPH